MSLLGNILWFLLGGFLLGAGYILVGLLFRITVIGIPFGLQHFKIAKLSLFPFGQSKK